MPTVMGCRRRMEGIVQEYEPEMWARHVRRHGEPAVHIEADPGSGVGPQEDQAVDDKLRGKDDE